MATPAGTEVSRRHSDSSPTDLARRYLGALADGDGTAAARLFAADGVIDDLRGGHHHGRAEIEAFISARPALTVAPSVRERKEADRIYVYGYIHYGSGDVSPTRWLFTVRSGELIHLCNSRLSSLEERALSGDH